MRRAIRQTNNCLERQAVWGRWRLDLSAVLLVLVVAAGLSLASLTPILGQGYDDGRYAVLAKALAGGAGYTFISLPAAPAEGRYPPGYPLFLAPVWWLPLDLSARIVALKSLSVVAGLGSAIAGYLFLVRRGYAGRQLAGLLVALTVLNPSVFLYTREVLSEMLYTATSLLAVWAIEWYGDSRSGRPCNARLAGAVLAATATFYVRSIGLVLPIAGVIYLCLRGQARRAALLGIATALLASPWLLHPTGPASGGNASYLAQFLSPSPDQGVGTVGAIDLAARLLDNVHSYLLAGLAGAVFPSVAQPTWVNLPPALQLHPPLLPLSLALSVMLVAGFATALAFRRRLVDLYVALYLIVCLFWAWEASRLLVPLTLFLYLYLLQPFADLPQTLPLPPSARRVAAVLAALPLMLYLLGAVSQQVAFAGEARSPAYGLPPEKSALWQDTLGAYAWVRDNTAPNAVLAAYNDTQAYIYTDRRTVQEIGSREEMLRQGVDYVLVIPFPALTGGYDLAWLNFEPLLLTHGDAFVPTYQGAAARVRVYRVQRDRLGQ